MPEDPTSQELRIAQLKREHSERERAEREREIDPESDDTPTQSHDRRAEKAAYLREKLEERAEAERKADR